MPFQWKILNLLSTWLGEFWQVESKEMLEVRYVCIILPWRDSSPSALTGGSCGMLLTWGISEETDLFDWTELFKHTGELDLRASAVTLKNADIAPGGKFICCEIALCFSSVKQFNIREAALDSDQGIIDLSSWIYRTSRVCQLL